MGNYFDLLFQMQNVYWGAVVRLSILDLSKTISENCVDNLFFYKSKIDNLTKKDLYDLLPAAAKKLGFFDSSLCLQIDGVGMGPPLSPNLRMCLIMKENG